VVQHQKVYVAVMVDDGAMQEQEFALKVQD
jgi:hypothetical protein